VKYLIILIFLFLPNCTSFTVASVGSNAVTYTTTGKTNSDHIISLIAGQDCRIFRIVKNKKICDQKNTILALNETTKNFEDTEYSRNNEIFKNTINAAYHITKNVIKDHATIGVRITDKIKLTNELEKKTESKFNNVVARIERKGGLIKENFKKENVYKNIFKKDFWKERVEEEEEKRKKIKKKFLKVFKKIKIYNNKEIYVSNNKR
jgi:hypothetical protein